MNINTVRLTPEIRLQLFEVIKFIWVIKDGGICLCQICTSDLVEPFLAAGNITISWVVSVL